MGYEFDATAILDFSGTRYRGVEVVVRADVSIGEYQAFLDATTLDNEWTWFQRHALVSWNIEKEGVPMPISTPASGLPAPFIRRVLRGWQTAFAEIDAPLDLPSTSP